MQLKADSHAISWTRAYYNAASYLRSARRLVMAASLLLAMGVIEDSVRAEDAPGVTSDEIRLGSFGAFAGQGYLFGRLIMNGMDAVFHQVNADGGVYGRKLILIRQDDRCDPDTAVAAIRTLVSVHKVFALLGGGCSNATLAARPEIEKAQIPFINVASVADGISNPVSKYIYATQLTATIESEAQLQYAIDHGAKKIAIVAQHDAWGRAGYDPLVADFKRRNLGAVIDLQIGPEETDASHQALRIAEVGADAVLLVLYPKPGTAVTRALAKLGFKPILIGQTAIDPLALPAAVGVPGGADRYVTPATVRHLPSDPEMKGWTALLKNMFPEDEPSTFNLMGIGAAQVMVAALRAAGPHLTRERFLAAMAHIRVETDTLSSTIICEDPSSHQCNRTPAWIGMLNGRPQIIDPRK
jgi:branched-chain amino acid transport system substrate-binding protein